MLRNKLLVNGYLPKELPECFNSTSFLEAISSLDQGKWAFSLSNLTPIHAAHLISTSPQANRLLGIPNPISHMGITEFIHANWTDLQNRIHLSKFSKSMPEEGGLYTRALMAWEEYADEYLGKIREDIYKHGGYLLKTDIKNFYPTLQFKTIKRAIQTALPQVSSSEIDSIIHLINGNQTFGVPVGPDWSFLIAELVMTDIDLALESQFPNIIGFRFYDDFEFITYSKADAENVLEALGNLLQEDHLSVNWDKTKIIDVPKSITPIWMERLVALITTTESEAPSLSRYREFLETTQHYTQKYPQEQVLRLAIAQIRNYLPVWTKAHHSGHEEISRATILFLINAISIDPKSIQLIIQTLISVQNTGYDVTEHRKDLEITINSLIKQASKANNENIALWGLYACLSFSLPIYSETAQSILFLNDPFIMILVFNLIQLGLFPTTIQQFSAKLQAYLKADELYGKHWILAYEFAYHGWINEFGIDDYLDDNFATLKKNGVHFYDNTNYGLRKQIDINLVFKNL